MDSTDLDIVLISVAHELYELRSKIELEIEEARKIEDRIRKVERDTRKLQHRLGMEISVPLRPCLLRLRPSPSRSTHRYGASWSKKPKKTYETVESTPKQFRSMTFLTGRKLNALLAFSRETSASRRVWINTIY